MLSNGREGSGVKGKKKERRDRGGKGTQPEEEETGGGGTRQPTVAGNGIDSQTKEIR